MPILFLLLCEDQFSISYFIDLEHLRHDIVAIKNSKLKCTSNVSYLFSIQIGIFMYFLRLV